MRSEPGNLFDVPEDEPIRPHAWYLLAEVGDVEVIEISPVRVWFRRAGESRLAQQPMAIEEFRRRASLVHGGRA